jgi:hypothetical protein
MQICACVYKVRELFHISDTRLGFLRHYVCNNYYKLDPWYSFPNSTAKGCKVWNQTSQELVGRLCPARIQAKKSTIFWNITPCSPLSVNRSFGGTYRLHLQGRENKLSKKPE